ncbi:MAG: hypothetical protein ACK4SY_03530 [Pyrobaculum sp.]
MIDLIIAGVLAIVAGLGGVFIKDLKALLIFTALIAAAAFLISLLINMPVVTLGLAGLLTAVVKISMKISPRGESKPLPPEVSRSRARVYRSRRRLRALEELTRRLPQDIVDIIPAGSRRVIHPKLVQLVSLANEAYAKGYVVEEPQWFREVRQYLAFIGPNSSPDKTKVVSRYEIVDLE